MKMKKVGLMTSGGDSPGMNAAIRAVVRTLLYNNIEAIGFYNGYDGMVNGDYVSLTYQSVSGIIQLGGTILGSARSDEFRTEKGRAKAYEVLSSLNIDGMIVIGGDGTFTGANVFSKEYNIPFLGLPGTIDNDLYGTDFTIGYDTALNTIVQSIDKIRDTASSHHRLFLVEVMGRDAGFLALNSGIAVGAEDILIPEMKTDIDEVVRKIENGKHLKKSRIIVVAEGDDAGGAFEVAKEIKERLSWVDMRVSILGHIQRGGSPTAKDRLIASILGVEAVQFLINREKGCMVGIKNRKPVLVPFEKAIKHHNTPDTSKLNYLDMLSSV